MRGDSISDRYVLVNQDQRQITESNQTTRIVGHSYPHRVGDGVGICSETEVKQHGIKIVVLYQLIPILGMTQKERKGAIRIVRSCDLVW